MRKPKETSVWVDLDGDEDLIKEPTQTVIEDYGLDLYYRIGEPRPPAQATKGRRRLYLKDKLMLSFPPKPYPVSITLEWRGGHGRTGEYDLALVVTKGQVTLDA